MAGLNFSGYANAMIDLGFIAMTAFVRSGTSIFDAAARAALKNALAQKFLATALKALGKEVLKDVIKAYADQKIDFAGLVTKPMEDMDKKFLTEIIKAAVLRVRMEGLMARGAVPYHCYEAMRRLVKEKAADPIGDVVGQTLSFYSMAIDAATTHTKWEILLMKRNHIMKQATEVSLELDQAIDEADIAKADYDYCLKLQQETVERF